MNEQLYWPMSRTDCTNLSLLEPIHPGPAIQKKQALASSSKAIKLDFLGVKRADSHVIVNV